MNEHGDYPEITQRDSESTDDTDIKDTADIVETYDLDERLHEIIESTVSQQYEERAEKAKKLDKERRRSNFKRDLAIVLILLIAGIVKNLVEEKEKKRNRKRTSK